MAELRWAGPADVENLLTLIEAYHRQEGLKGHSPQEIRPVVEDLFEMPNRGRILLAIEEDALIGYALVVRRPSLEWACDLAVIDEIFVLGRAREQGLGRRMIAFVEEFAASEGLPALTLEVSVKNVSAREFYRSVGFSRIDREIYKRVVSGPR